MHCRRRRRRLSSQKRRHSRNNIQPHIFFLFLVELAKLNSRAWLPRQRPSLYSISMSCTYEFVHNAQVQQCFNPGSNSIIIILLLFWHVWLAFFCWIAGTFCARLRPMQCIHERQTEADFFFLFLALFSAFLPFLFPDFLFVQFSYYPMLIKRKKNTFAVFDVCVHCVQAEFLNICWIYNTHWRRTSNLGANVGD